MNRTSLVVPFVLVAALATAAQAGWHHHRHAVYAAAPAYYMPAYAPSYGPSMQAAPSTQNALGDIIIAKLVDKLIGSIDKVDILPGTRREETKTSDNGSSGGSSIQQDLTDIKAALKDLDARVENANAALQRQGAEILAIRQATETLKNDLTGYVDESSVIGKAAKKTMDGAKSLSDIESALSKPEFKTAADAYKAAPAPAAGMPDKPIQDLRDAVKGLLK